MNPEAPSTPLGLTLLAIANFFVGGMFSILAFLGFMLLVKSPAANEAAKTTVDVSDTMSLIIGGGLLGLLGITSGIGYLNRKRLIGHRLGTAFGVLGTVVVPVQLALGSHDFGFIHALFLACFMVNVVLVNTTYRKSFINP